MKWRLLAALVLALGCGDDDGGERDASLGRPDASASDGFTLDASSDGGSDAATFDSGSGDSGSGGSTDSGAADSSVDAGTDASVGQRLPPVNGRLDYQLGGDYSPPDGVTIVSRDRLGRPAPGLYNICYVNGYQVQPGEVDDWDEDLILRNDRGEPIIDADWDEAILDISSEDKRRRIAMVVGGWIDQCARDGFDAIEIDNLDTYSRVRGRISEDDAVAFMAMLSERAHARGVAIAQKNSAEILSRQDEMGTDFVVVEECGRYRECEDFIDAYGDLVLMIEYRIQDFERSCADLADTHAIVLRDLNLVTPEGRGYVYDDC
ncbi:MAG: endo alpha-1,4 polygalactosaminidase [Polyangiales bacterium]